MKQNDFNLQHLISSINQLKFDTKPVWGNMNCAQILKHCNRQAKLYCNEYKSSCVSLILANSIGKLHLFYIKHIIKYDINKYRKNSKSLKFLNTSNINNIDFEVERSLLIERLKFVNNYKKTHITYPMHGTVKNNTFKKNIFAHVKYHLNQFNALTIE